MLLIVLVGWAVVLPILVVVGLYAASALPRRRHSDDDIGTIDITAFASEFVRAGRDHPTPAAAVREPALGALQTDGPATAPPSVGAGY